jgi:hypothetical protein
VFPVGVELKAWFEAGFANVRKCCAAKLMCKREATAHSSDKEQKVQDGFVFSPAGNGTEEYRWRC